MAINFPSSPTLNQEYTFGTKTWVWNATAWALKQNQPTVLLDMIKTVDGTGSGLDADVLDGSHASAFYLASNPSGYITSSASISGNAATATTLQTSRTIALTGDVAYTSGSFNGSANVTGTATLATVNANVGSFGSSTTIPVVTVNAKGLVTAVSTATVSGGQYFGTAATKAIAYNANSIGENVTVTTGNNGLSAGPITVNTGFTVTVQSGAVWTVV